MFQAFDFFVFVHFPGAEKSIFQDALLSEHR